MREKIAVTSHTLQNLGIKLFSLKIIVLFIFYERERIYMWMYTFNLMIYSIELISFEFFERKNKLKLKFI
jgi:hypothetical protein